MTIEKLHARLDTLAEFRKAGHSAPSTALVFAFDKGYVMPFKVMIYSMLRNGILCDSPVVIMSDDANIMEDEVVRCVTDEFHLIDGRLKDQLYTLARENIGRPDRHQWNKGTCLKWAVFRDCAYDNALFLDVDMLCLGDLRPLLERAPDADLVASPQFQRTMVAGADGPASPQEVAQRLRGMLDESAKPYMGRLNSGVMHVRKKLLSDAFRNELLAYASQRTQINEQSHLTHFFKNEKIKKKYKIRLVSSAYNFHESYLKQIDRIDAQDIAKFIKILHYPGSPKPWDTEIDSNIRMTTLLWWQYRISAGHFGLL